MRTAEKIINTDSPETVIRLAERKPTQALIHMRSCVMRRHVGLLEQARRCIDIRRALDSEISRRGVPVKWDGYQKGFRGTI